MAFNLHTGAGDIRKFVDLGNAHPHPAQLKTRQQHLRDGFGQCFEQFQPVPGKQCLHGFAHGGVIDRVAQAVAMAGGKLRASQREVDADRLRQVLFVVVDTNHRLGAKALQKNNIHRGAIIVTGGGGKHGIKGGDGKGRC